VFVVRKGKGRSLVHPLIDRCHVNDEWMGTWVYQGEMPWVQGWHDDYLGVGGSNRGYMSYRITCFSTLLYVRFAFS